MSFAKLDDLGRKLEALEHALSILGADEATHMAVGGGDKRAEAMANLAGMYHAQATAPEIADWIAAAKPESEDQTLALAEFERQYINATCLPTEFVERRTAATMRSEQLWRDLRAKGDWDSFLPALEGVVALVREAPRNGSTLVATIHPSAAANRCVSRGTDLVDGRPWRLASVLVDTV